MSSYRTDFVFVLAAICVVHSAAFADQDGPGLPPPPADRIAYYSQQVAKHSRHYPAYALLGAAWLDQARLTYDPRDLAQARAAFQRSLEIQPNFEALKGMAAACNYSHRFAEALQWCRQAADAFPQDTSLLAMQVEAHLALGQVDQARRCVGGLPDQPRDYYTAVAQAMVHAALGEDTRAVAAYLAAARLAHDQNAAPLAVWAHVAAAGLFLDSGNLQAARPHLEAAQRAGVPPAEPNRPGRAADQPQTAKPAHWDPSAAFLGLHQAELAEAEGRLHQALSLYESLLERRADPELFRRAYLLSTRLHETHRARRHFAAAERLCRLPIEHGEHYSLESLANLYCDARIYPDQALRLAETNLKFKQDISAQKTLARARTLQAQSTANQPLRSEAAANADSLAAPSSAATNPWPVRCQTIRPRAFRPRQRLCPTAKL